MTQENIDRFFKRNDYDSLKAFVHACNEYDDPYCFLVSVVDDVTLTVMPSAGTARSRRARPIHSSASPAPYFPAESIAGFAAARNQARASSSFVSYGRAR